jgi:hypothetical protein
MNLVHFKLSSKAVLRVQFTAVVICSVRTEGLFPANTLIAKVALSLPVKGIKYGPKKVPCRYSLFWCVRDTNHIPRWLPSLNNSQQSHCPCINVQKGFQAHDTQFNNGDESGEDNNY